MIASPKYWYRLQHGTPGATQICARQGACVGAQSCREDGKGYTPCGCDTDTDTTSNSGSSDVSRPG
ncbi:MAG: hypothetical protein HRU17_21760 [Polyangiaceae bacterium]|nr:hypothetical protein [Polyangiaceae bacterium]